MFNKALLRVLAGQDDYCLAYGKDIESSTKGERAQYGDIAELEVPGGKVVCYMDGSEGEGDPVATYYVRAMDEHTVVPDEVSFEGEDESDDGDGNEGGEEATGETEDDEEDEDDEDARELEAGNTPR